MQQLQLLTVGITGFEKKYFLGQKSMLTKS